MFDYASSLFRAVSINSAAREVRMKSLAILYEFAATVAIFLRAILLLGYREILGISG